MTLTPLDVLDVLVEHTPAPGISGAVLCGCGRLTGSTAGQLEHTAQAVADAIHTGGIRLADGPHAWIRAADAARPGRLDDAARLSVPIAGGAYGTVATGHLLEATVGQFGLVELTLIDTDRGAPRTRTVVVTSPTWIGVLP